MEIKFRSTKVIAHYALWIACQTDRTVQKHLEIVMVRPWLVPPVVIRRKP